MTFVFPLLLGGLVLVGIPVLIHLIMRQKPKLLPFPAFRFLVQKSRRNLRKLRLRHLLLLALRVFLIAAVCLALARPRLFSEAFSAGPGQPVAAVLVLDTLPHMEYQVPAAAKNRTRLEDAQAQARLLLEKLPAESRVAVLDTAGPLHGGRAEWLSPYEARQKVDSLRRQFGRGSVTERLADAYAALNDLARGKDEAARGLGRLVCVFSDRTRASWDPAQVAKLHEARDLVPPSPDRLAAARERIPALAERLGELPSRLPPSPQGYTDKTALELLDRARDRLAAVADEGPAQTELVAFVTDLRAALRKVLSEVEAARDRTADEAKGYRDALAASLRDFLYELRGAHEVYADVGVDNPIDGAILELEPPRDGRQGLPRQEFVGDEKFVVRATVHAAGRDLENALVFQMGARKEQVAIAVRAGEKKSYSFEVDCKGLAPGPHQMLASLANPDLMPFNNTRYFTFHVREPRRILIVTDDPGRADDLKAAHEALRARGYRVDVRKPEEALRSRKFFSGYRAVYLMNVPSPSAELWARLGEYARLGGGVAVIPDPESVVAAYNSAEAQSLLPARLGGAPQKADTPKAGQWDWKTAAYGHPMMAPFRDWKGFDLVSQPRTATYFWPVEVQVKGAAALVHYHAGAPALAARELEAKGGRGGRVLLFTTTMDYRRPPWNDYLSELNSFFIALTDLATTYLAGETEARRHNFVSGHEVPLLVLPPEPRFHRYTLSLAGEHVATVNTDPAANAVTFPQATAPGNYTVEAEGNRVGAFSVNVAADESVLVRLPVAEVEALLGPGAVTTTWSEEEVLGAIARAGGGGRGKDLLPLLLLAVLIALALENLLANKFYRREPEPQA